MIHQKMGGKFYGLQTAVKEIEDETKIDNAQDFLFRLIQLSVTM